MKKIAGFLVKARWILFGIVAAIAVASCFTISLTRVNYDMGAYLPSDMETKQAIVVMEEEFGVSGNTRVMLKDVSYAQAFEYKNTISAVGGVTSVTFADAALSVLPSGTLQGIAAAAGIADALTLTDMQALDALVQYGVPLPAELSLALSKNYKDGNALFELTLSGSNYDLSSGKTIAAIRDALGSKPAYFAGGAATADATRTLATSQIFVLAIAAVVIVLAVLFIFSKSWIEPIVFIVVIGISVLINMGTNFLLGPISYITQSVAALLQLAIAMDYSIFLLHAFRKARETEGNVLDALRTAVAKTLSPISASGLTTIAGFVALMFMRYSLGLDLGLVLAKGIVISLITVFSVMPAVLGLLDKALVKTSHRMLIPSFAKVGRGVSKARIVLPILALALFVPAFFAQNSNSFLYGESAGTLTEGTQVYAEKSEVEAVFGAHNQLVVLLQRTTALDEYNVAAALSAVEGTTSVNSLSTSLGVYTAAEMAQNPIVAAFGIGEPTLNTVYAAFGLVKASPVELLDKMMQLGFITQEKLEQVLGPQTIAQLDALKSAFVGSNYSRILVSSEFPEESAETFAYIEAVRAAVDASAPTAVKHYVTGESAAVNDIKTVVAKDYVTTTWITIGMVALILIITFRSAIIPAVLIAVIEGSIWMNMAIPFLMGSPLLFLGYLIISTLQLGATIDYAILMTNNYRSARAEADKKTSIGAAVAGSAHSILCSSLILSGIGFALWALGKISSIRTMGMLLGFGTLFSALMVLTALPALLGLLDKAVMFRIKTPEKIAAAEKKALAAHMAEESGTVAAEPPQKKQKQTLDTKKHKNGVHAAAKTEKTEEADKTDKVKKSKKPLRLKKLRDQKNQL